MKGKKYLTVSLAAALCLSGCSAAEESETAGEAPLSVVAILKARNSLHWNFVMEGLEQTARGQNVELTVLWPEKESDVEVQNRLIVDAVHDQPDVILLAPDDSAHVSEMAEQIQEAGIRLIYMDENAEDNTEIPYVGSDNYHAGELAAESIQDLLTEGEVVYIGGSQQQQVHRLRGQGFADAVSEAAFTVLPLKEVPDCSISGGRAAMEQVLEEYPQVKAVFCASALLCMGAQEACQSAGREDVLLVGMDTQSDVLSALEQDRIHAIISQSGYEIGCRAMELALQQQEGEEIPVLNYIENEIITKENVQEYLDAFVREGRE